MAEYSDSSSSSSTSFLSRRSAANNSQFVSRIQDNVAKLYYKHGLICSSHPWIVILIALIITSFCAYPILGIHYLLGNSWQSHVTSVNDLDLIPDSDLISSNVNNRVGENTNNNHAKSGDNVNV